MFPSTPVSLRSNGRNFCLLHPVLDFLRSSTFPVHLRLSLRSHLVSGRLWNWNRVDLKVGCFDRLLSKHKILESNTSKQYRRYLLIMSVTDENRYLRLGV